ncbi:hypothetical protein SAMN04490220_9169 [Rhodococcus jostii]|uniref:Secreted protein n=1 Tax=Rhodococcus jostii TaxID=132919 RepID=A0A1H5MNN3_RHOJO|nr:hypothetical protein SAMN04490220_9169 [Rhodococcus jostii]
MRCRTDRRLGIAWTAAFAAGCAFSLGLSAVAAAGPPPPGVTTGFAVPATFVSGCFSLLMCTVPPVVAVTPSAATQAPGVVTFTAQQSGAIVTPDCLDVVVNWRNLSTPVAGTAVLRGVTPVDFSRPTAPEEWCRYTPVAVVTGSGMVAASADASADLDRFQLAITPGFGTFAVP